MDATFPVPWQLTACELAQLFADGASTPTAALDSVLDRLDAVNGAINAVVTLDLPGARDAARQSDWRWRERRPLGPLDGVPVTVKDNLFVGGLRATWGSLLYADHVAPCDDLPVAALRRAGMVILGKTNTPELALLGHTDNRLFGSTGNPWDPSRSAGGSSGGAAAAVAAGIGPLALATDAGGSIRRPAGLAGLAGLKPGAERVPRRHGFLPLAHDLQVIGPLARCVADLHAAFALVAADAQPLPAMRRLRIAAFDGFPGLSCDPKVQAAFVRGLSVLRGLGHAVEEVSPPWDAVEAGAIFGALAAAGVARVVRRHPGWRERVTPVIAALADEAQARSAADHVEWLDRRNDFAALVSDRLAGWDVLATPASPSAGWPRERSHPETLGGAPAGPRSAGAFSVAVNLAGLPALSIPAPVPAGAMPVGLQLVGPRGGEELLLALAAGFEASAPWPRHADPAPSSDARGAGR